MTAVRRALPLLRLPPLAETPALARILVAAAWLWIALFGRPLAVGLLLVFALITLVVASGYTPAALWRTAWRWVLLIGLAGAIVFLVSIAAGWPAATAGAVDLVLRLSLIVALTMLVALPQDAEVAAYEATGLLRLPARLVFGLLVLARVLTAVPRDFEAYRTARRSRDMARGGLLGVFLEPVLAVPHVVGAARQRLRWLRTSVQTAALGSTSPRSMYRSVSFGPNGRYVLVAGTIVALISLIVGLL